MANPNTALLFGVFDGYSILFLFFNGLSYLFFPSPFSPPLLFILLPHFSHFFRRHGIKGLEAARESGRDINNYFNRTNNLPSASSASPSSGSTSTILPNAKTQEWVDVTLHDAFRHAQEVLLQIEANNKQVV